ncbi:hypothetical protein GMES_0577 [Paraglaciecola mesophila KMM 241]|uniref:Uncharacterized protein n=1 Tax=Paraglaciecola mesophila KMM 241 TaxID=1128912 RepID=K6Z1M8_9ALTE|nr:hypothetical protein GMES_0577 [Paraglaciecola mesophila KMM 241]
MIAEEISDVRKYGSSGGIRTGYRHYWLANVFKVPWTWT